MEAALREIPDYDQVQASFISHEWADLHRPRVAQLKAQGAAILCWTIKSAEAEATAQRIAAGAPRAARLNKRALRLVAPQFHFTETQRAELAAYATGTKDGTYQGGNAE